MRKADEITLLDTLIQQTPRNSYLRSMLEYMKPQFERDIRSDFSTLPDFTEVERDRLRLEQEIRDAHKRRDEIDSAIEAAKRTRLYAIGQLKKLDHALVSATQAVALAEKQWEEILK